MIDAALSDLHSWGGANWSKINTGLSKIIKNQSNKLKASKTLFHAQVPPLYKETGIPFRHILAIEIA